jgi:hypothetical protein
MPSSGIEVGIVISFLVVFVATVIACSLPMWSVMTTYAGIEEYRFGLWRQCTKTSVSVNCGDISLDVFDCMQILKAARAFSVLGILFSFAAAAATLVASVSGNRFFNAVLPLLCALTTSCTMICWLVYGGFSDDNRCGSMNEYGASFGLQVGAFAISCLASAATVALHWVHGGLGLSENAVVPVQLSKEVKTRDNDGQIVLSDAANVP